MMRNLIIGVIIGMMISATAVWAASAFRIVDSSGNAVQVDGSALRITF